MRLMNVDNFTGPVNIGNPNEMTILEVVQYIKEITNSLSVVTFHELPSDDPKRRCPDITLAKSKLDWYPKIKFKEGIQNLYNYIKSVENDDE